MQVLKKLTTLKEHRCFEEGFSIDFRPGLNILVGDQGSGKSTVISMLTDPFLRDAFDIMFPKKQVCTIETEGDCKFLFHDAEKHNPRIVKDLELTHQDTGIVLDSNFKSHGQSALPFIINLKKAKGYLMFLDEPESGLSIRSQIKIAEVLQEVSKENQIIASTHSEIIIRIAGIVYSLEHKKWMTADEFITSQHQPLNETKEDVIKNE